MQKILNIAVLVALQILISSCDSTREQKLINQLEVSEQANIKLQKEYGELKQAVQSDKEMIYQYQRSVGIAAGCDWLIAICPEEFVENGRAAMRNGYSPNLFYFWLNVFLKIIAIALFMTVSISTLVMIYLRILRPSSAKVEFARDLIESSTHKSNELLTEIKTDINNKQIELEELSMAKAVLIDYISQFKAQKGELTRQCENLENEITRFKEIHEVLKVLD